MKKTKGEAFICFVGIDGSGKTTHTLNLKKHLLARGYRCVYLRPRYELIRSVSRYASERIGISEIILSPRMRKMNFWVNTSLIILKIPLILLFLMYAFLTYFVIIKPRLREFVVVCDRYFFDWFYKICGKGSLGVLRLLPKPHLTFLLDLPIAFAFSRMNSAFDKKVPPDYYESLREWYLALAKQQSFILVDSGADLEETQALILNYVISYLGA